MSERFRPTEKKGAVEKTFQVLNLAEVGLLTFGLLTANAMLVVGSGVGLAVNGLAEKEVKKGLEKVKNVFTYKKKTA